jgi:hypothetical protein
MMGDPGRPRMGPAHSSTRQWSLIVAGADDRDRTGDLVLTKDVLCQLSYIGLRPWGFGRQVGLAHLTAHQPIRRRLGRQPQLARRMWGASEGWSGRRESNPRPTAWKAETLPLSYSRLRAPTSPRAPAGKPAWLRAYFAPRSGREGRLATRPPLGNAPAASPSRFGEQARLAIGQAREGWLASRSRPSCQAREGWWRGEDSNLRSR